MYNTVDSTVSPSANTKTFSDGTKKNKSLTSYINALTFSTAYRHCDLLTSEIKNHHARIAQVFPLLCPVSEVLYDPEQETPNDHVSSLWSLPHPLYLLIKKQQNNSVTKARSQWITLTSTFIHFCSIRDSIGSIDTQYKNGISPKNGAEPRRCKESRRTVRCRRPTGHQEDRKGPDQNRLKSTKRLE